MTRKPRRSIIGPAAFVATLTAVLLFFWWLLIFDHGLPAAQ